MAKGVKRLKELVEKSRQYGEFTLSSGLKANHYFDFKMALTDPKGSYLIGEEIFKSLVWRIFKLIVKKRVEAVGGYGLGASLIVAAVVVISYLKGKPISGFTVREEGKEYVIEGHLPATGGKVAIVDDVCTTGRSIFNAIKAVEDRRYQVVLVRVPLDRQQGGSEELRRRGYNFKALLRADNSGNVYIN